MKNKSGTVCFCYCNSAYEDHEIILSRYQFNVVKGYSFIFFILFHPLLNVLALFLRVLFTMNEEYIVEHHPDWHHDIPVMRVLILGNFPPHKKRWDYEFFYPNKLNNFWKMLAVIAGAPLEKPLQETKGEAAVKERKAIMEKLEVGVFNIAKVIRRKGHSARDTDIEILEYNDVITLILKHPELKKIILAGFAAASSTTRKFLEYLEHHKVPFERPPQIKAGTEFLVHFPDRKISCVILNSTSTAFPIGLPRLVEQFRPHIRPGKKGKSIR